MKKIAPTTKTRFRTDASRNAADTDCGPLFKNLGLPFDNEPAGVQRFFSAE